MYATGNASMDYIGPSFSAGGDYHLRKRLLLTGYVHYFKKQRKEMSQDIGLQTGHFEAVTVAGLMQYRFSRKERSYLFGAIGLALQHITEDYADIYYQFNDKRLFVTPALRVGYSVPAFNHRLAIEINATGPHSYAMDLYQTQEILTLLSLGLRFAF